MSLPGSTGSYSREKKGGWNISRLSASKMTCGLSSQQKPLAGLLVGFMVLLQLFSPHETVIQDPGPGR